ncbi:glycosyltransferase family 20 protein [Suillus plorans]|uniref:Glycosyltransferase family 20 protein n=1 Tax=Suillus plorans TaxID=116603 RepID=A0A9P7ARG3_9AGAM|nr:glycosyltransferase family 20 protein [Suillus plorans]KAG1793553.1 glycosyltransferase family 20 protein [Suillus plorans]
MSSLRNHRVIIASLFLPTTAVPGESSPPTPDIYAREAGTTAATQDLGGRPPAFRHASSRSIGSTPAPLKSIVDDLKSRAITPITTPPSELNPFSKFASLAPSPAGKGTISPSSIRNMDVSLAKFQPDPLHPIRLQRRSSSKPPRYPTRSYSNTSSEPYYFAPNIHCNGGLKNAVDSVKDRMTNKLWVGTLGSSTDAYNTELKASIDRRMKELHSSLPVWIPDAEFESCYDEFCHQVLWPCLHYAVPDAPKTKLFFESAAFKQYAAVNKRFAEAIESVWMEGDVVWINDYHLMLLPLLLRQSTRVPALASATIGFFMHVAFPSSEIFRCLSVREHLLRGMLGADLVGFQTASYARHFRQTVSRILAVEALPKGIQVGFLPRSDVEYGIPGGAREGHGRFVDVGIFPMGIDVGALRERRREPDVSYWVQLLRQRYAGMMIVVGRDKLDEIQGVRHKLEAFELFLKKWPEYQGKVILLQVALQTTESNELAAGGVSDVVARINSAFSTLTYQPVVFLHTQEVTFSQYLALLTVADAFLVTSLREGMALRTHEFVECQDGRHRPLILSEFTGSYSYSGFRSCIAVNPYDTHGTAKAIHQALTMSDEEALSRWEDLHNHVVTQTAQTFVISFLTRCLRANTEHTIQTDLNSVPALNTTLLLPRYKHSSRRILLLDFEGTLWRPDMSRAGLLAPFVPPEGAVELLNKFSANQRNEVWLLSGLPIKSLEQVAAKAPGVGIVAENGCFAKIPVQNGKGGVWISMVANLNLTWKGLCVEILNYFTERTPGSFVEEREASVVWRFWTGPTDDCADRQWARRQAAEAQNHIFDSLGERYGLRIIPGSNSFLVLPNNISRSTAVGAILHPGGPAHSPRSSSMPDLDVPVSGGGGEAGFVFAVGSDEKLLRRLNELDNAETVSTSGKGTDAKWKLDAGDVGNTMWLFANSP